MDEKIDKKTEDALMKALENAKAYGQRLQENREQRLWKKSKFHAVFIMTCGLTKGEMDNIRKKYDLKNLSTLKKHELADELSRLIPMKFKAENKDMQTTNYVLNKGKHWLLRLA